jgi:hypothetical protein
MARLLEGDRRVSDDSMTHDQNILSPSAGHFSSMPQWQEEDDQDPANGAS